MFLSTPFLLDAGGFFLMGLVLDKIKCTGTGLVYTSFFLFTTMGPSSSSRMTSGMALLTLG